MAKSNKKEAKEESLEKKLWKAADKLRKNIDAAEYKHIVLGLIFLKYISDAYEELREKLEKGEGEYEGADPEDKNEYKAEKIFFVPEKARWKYLQGRAKLSSIGKDIDDAMDLIEKDNESLKGVLPKGYAHEKLDKQTIGGLIDEFSTATLGTSEAKSKDLLGKVYEYFLGQFALAEGKKGGQFYTPASVVKLLVELIEPYEGRVFDPCCGSGGMFVQSEKFVNAHSDHYKKGNHKRLAMKPSERIAIYGQESNQTTWRLCKMNLSIHSIDSSNVKWNNEGSFLNNLHKDLKADFVLANPPFNDSDWGGNLLSKDSRWKYGKPPTSNGNFAWIQHIIYHLSINGVAGIVMHCGAASNKTISETEIRKNIIKEGLVDCIIALPTQLFSNTTLPVHLWLLKRKKNEINKVLMIDAYDLGFMVESTLRELTENDILKISETYHKWMINSKDYNDEDGFCKSVTLDEISKKSFILSPNRYVDRIKKARDDEYSEKIDKDLKLSLQEMKNIDSLIKKESFKNENLVENFFEIFNEEKTNKESWDLIELKDLIKETITGNWGVSNQLGNIPVKVIRGTDLPNLPLFNLKKTPTRYLKKEKVELIKLKEFDIVVELSGGSKNQPTGRIGLITPELIKYFDTPLICSNFCKVIRLDHKMVNPYWFYYYWIISYQNGLTTRYENQPSGIKNFQLDEFLESEVILLPKREYQDKVSSFIGLYFTINNKFRFIGNKLEKALELGFENIYYDFRNNK